MILQLNQYHYNYCPNHTYQYILINCHFEPEEKQALLEAIDIKKRSEVLIALSEIAIASRNTSKTTFIQ